MTGPIFKQTKCVVGGIVYYTDFNYSVVRIRFDLYSININSITTAPYKLKADSDKKGSRS